MSKPTYRIADILREKAGQYELTIFYPLPEIRKETQGKWLGCDGRLRDGG